MKKAALILTMIAGMAFTSKAAQYSGKLYWWTNSDGTATIKCLGRDGNCTTVGRTQQGYVITMYNNGDASSIFATVKADDIEVNADEEGNIEITYTPAK